MLTLQYLDHKKYPQKICSYLKIKELKMTNMAQLNTKIFF